MAQGSGVMAQGSGFRVWGSGFRVQGSVLEYFTNFFNFSSILFVFHLTINLFLFIILLLPIGAWLSLVERCVRDAEVASSNLVAPTKNLFPVYLGTGFLFSVLFFAIPSAIPKIINMVVTFIVC